MTSDQFKRAASILAVAATLSACSGMGTVVDENDPETEIPNLSLGRSIMEGLGAVESRQQPINYSPRAPLVVPADTEVLAQPEDPARLASDPEWPLDPEVATVRRLREAEEREAARGDRGNTIAGSELLAVRTPPRPGPRANDAAGEIVAPSKLSGSFPAASEASLYDSQGRPVRRALVEPPVTYLEPAPGAPVAIPEEPRKGFFSWLW